MAISGTAGTGMAKHRKSGRANTNFTGKKKKKTKRKKEKTRKQRAQNQGSHKNKYRP